MYDITYLKYQERYGGWLKNTSLVREDRATISLT